MSNPLIEKVEPLLTQVGLHDAELIHESYHPESFGNALAVYRQGNLQLNFLRDRGDDVVSVVSSSNADTHYSFDDLSILMGWTTIEAIIEESKSVDFSQPLQGPIPLGSALGLVKEHLEELQQMFSEAEIDKTLSKLRETSRSRSKALFG